MVNIQPPQIPSFPTGVVPAKEIEALVGEEIGSGKNRTVYRCKDNPNFVIKHSIRQPHFSNYTEWLVYIQVKNFSAIAIYFAECLALSLDGQFLIMEYLEDVQKGTEYDVPCWVTDPKLSAVGRNKSGTIKIRDYGHVSLGSVLINAPLVTRGGPDPDMQKLLDAMG